MRLKPKRGMYLSVYCEDGPLASGWRHVVIISAGRRWISMIEPSTLQTARIGYADFDKLAPRPVPGPYTAARLTSVARRMRARRALFRRCGQSLPENGIRAAIALLIRKPVSWQ